MSNLDSPIKPIQPIEASLRWNVACVLAGMANDRSLTRAGLYQRLGRPRQTVDNWLKARVMPRLEEFPDIDAALGFPKGETLVRSGFVDEEALAKRWLATTDTINDEFRGFIIDGIEAAQRRSLASAPQPGVAEQGRLVS